MKLSSLTDIGVKREDNQDNYWSARLDVDGKEMGVICLCDGMGGMDNGGLASRVVVKAVRDFFKNYTDFKDLVTILNKVNTDLYIKSKTEKVSLGTTCTVICCYEGKYEIYHIGDSRCYHRDSNKVSILTKDHTVIEKYKEAGRELPPHLVKKYKNTLTKCIGVSNKIELDYYNGTYNSGDLFLVCSDGFWHFLENESFFNSDFYNLHELIKRYIINGETDNITVGILEC